MDFDKVLQKRYSCRNYSSKEVSKKVIDKVLQKVAIAPTAKNMQPHNILVINGLDKVESIKDACPSLYNAPLVFVLIGDKNRECYLEINKRSLIETDLGIIGTYLMLSAESEGLNTCWVCRFDDKKLSKILKLEDNLQPFSLIIAGYESENSVPSERHTMRRQLDEYVKYM